MAAVTLQFCGGCAAISDRVRGLSPGPLAKKDSNHRIRPAELDELTRAFADRYVGLLSSTCDALKKDNLDPVQRREAQQFMLNSATNVYDIASNADAFTRMLDLVVVTNLVSGVWIDDGRQTRYTVALSREGQGGRPAKYSISLRRGGRRPGVRRSQVLLLRPQHRSASTAVTAGAAGCLLRLRRRRAGRGRGADEVPPGCGSKRA
jgi:hypothetical protein